MTDFPDTAGKAHVVPGRAERVRSKAVGYRLEEAYWGYRIVPVNAQQIRLIVQQVLALIAGAVCVAAGIALAVMGGGADMILRLPVILVALCIAGIMMWYASRGTQVQIEIDILQAEVRAVVANRTGATTVMARYGFDSIGSVFIARPEVGLPTLTLRYRNTARQLAVASGTEADLARLRDRMGRDLILNRAAA